MCQVFEKGRSALLNIDRSFKVELTFIGGGFAEAKVVDAVHGFILSSLPDAENAITFEASERKLLAIKELPIFKFASRTTQSDVTAVHSMVAKMKHNQAPADTIMNGDGVYSQVWTRLQFFARAKKAGTDVFGTEALAVLIAELEEQCNHAGRPVFLHELDLFKVLACKKNVAHAVQLKMPCSHPRDVFFCLFFLSVFGEG